MKKHSKRQSAIPTDVTVGLDVSDGYTHAAVIDRDGELVDEARLRTREPELRRWLMQWRQGCTVALETGTHSRWIARVITQCGQEAVVANARELRLIYGGHTKTDRLDAEKLARLARFDRTLLHPIEHRSEQEQADLAVIAGRELLVKMRTEAINTVRGLAKAFGQVIGKCSAEAFTAHADTASIKVALEI